MSNLLFYYNKLLIQFNFSSKIFYSIKQNLSIFLYKTSIHYKQGHSIFNLIEIINNYKTAQIKLEKDNKNLEIFKQQYLKQPDNRINLIKIDRNTQNNEFNEYIEIVKDNYTIEKRLFLLLTKINEYKHEINECKKYIDKEIKPIIQKIKKIQRNWRACRYNPKYKMCEIIFLKNLPEECIKN
tara:strand:- start:418 stop:966 length:549 start_codon:yes stop_codon:yes gene_type:complete